MPTPNDSHVDVHLTNLSLAYMQSRSSSFVASQIFPNLAVAKQSNLIRIYRKEDWLRSDMRVTGPGAMAPETDYNLDSIQYNCKVQRLARLVSDEEMANYDLPGDAEEDAARVLMEQAMLAREKQFMEKFFVPGVWGTDTTPANLWDTPSSTPLKDVQAARLEVKRTTGQRLNCMTVSLSVHHALQSNPEIIERFKHTTSDSITTDMFREYFEMDKYIVADATEVTSVEGAATSTFGFLAGNHCLLTHSPSAPSLMTPAAGYTAVWTGLTGINNEGMRTERFENRERHGTKIEVGLALDYVQTAADLGYFLEDVVS